MATTSSPRATTMIAASGGDAEDPQTASLLTRLSADRPGMPICLITGFLGAGKTTLVNHILRNSEGLRAAVFVNEYGSIDVDGALIKGHVDEDRVVSLTNGCVCCEINEDLAGKLAALLKKRRSTIDVVIIETSGVCDPDPVLATLQQIEDIDKVHLDSVICVSDATTISDKDFGASLDAKRQLKHADLILLSKVDLLSEEALKDAKQALLKACEHEGISPVILESVQGNIDLQVLLGNKLERPKRKPMEDPSPPEKRARHEEQSRDQDNDHDHDHDHQSNHNHKKSHDHDHRHSRFSSFVYRATKPFDMMKFEMWAQKELPGVLRAKGLVWLQGIPRLVCFHLAGRRTNPFETVHCSEKPSCSEIVFIGRSGEVSEGEIRRGLDACLIV